MSKSRRQSIYQWIILFFIAKKNCTDVKIIMFLLITEIDEVVNTIVFLLSDKASMIHGVTLPVDGGYLAT